jgi:hypothetical protein
VCDVESHSQTQLRTPDAELAELAARQHGVVAHAQLLALGFGAGAIKYRRGVGRLHLLRRGVYAVGHRPPSPLAHRDLGPVLACGPRAARIHVHRSPSRRQHPLGIRVTTPARTLVDLADVLTPKQLTRALNEARSNGSSPRPS